MQKVILWILFFFPVICMAEPKTTTPTVDPVKAERKDQFNLSSYLPIYFVYNSDVSKLQASFKYKIIRQSPFYFGYTQSMFWKLNENSKPIYDVNYNPELFYRFEMDGKTIESIDLIGIGHKSNGKEGEESRSFNYSAVQFNSQYKFENYLLRAGLRLKAAYSVEETNSDLLDYQGPYEINLTASQFRTGTIDKVELGVRFFPGGKYGEYISQGGQELNLSFRILGLEITPSFLLQYYHGYSESLRDYKKDVNVFRFGLLL